jgi:hypothetical protein
MAGLAYVANMAVVERLLDTKSQGTKPLDKKSQNRLGVWVLDSGANGHMLPHQSQFVGYEKLANDPKNVIGIGKTTLRAHGRGMVQLSDGNGKSVMLQSVLHVPDLKNGLLSLTRAAVDQGFETLIAGNSVTFTNGDLCIHAPIINGLAEYPVGLSAVANIGTELSVWHERFGHASSDSILKSAKEGRVTGLNIGDLEHVDAACEGCAIGKLTRSPYPLPNNRRYEKLELVHSDLCGPLQEVSVGGNKWFVTFIDDATRFCRVYAIPDKRAATVLNAFKIYKAWAENESGNKIKSLRTDGGLEYTGMFDTFLAQQGIAHQITPPYSPESNGLAERMNRTIMEMVRPMLHVHGYPLNLWAEAVFAANYLKNRLPNRMLDDKTPYEAWFGYKPEVGHLRRWGCIVYAHIPKQLRQKLDSKSRKGILVGYDATPYVYRIYDPVKKVILSTRDCKIAENEFYNFAETSSAPKPPGSQPESWR